MSIAKEYKQSLVKEITLPSGFTFTIKAVGPLAISKIMADNNITMEDIEKGSTDFNIKLVSSAVVEPKVVESNANEDELEACDILRDDLVFLINEILKFSGLTQNKDTVPLSKRK